MIPTLFASRLRARHLLAWLLPALLLGALAVFLYTESPLAQVRALQGELPELFTVLGFYGDSSLPLFLLSYLYGLILPLLSTLLAIHLAARLITRPLLDGRMAMLLSASHSRGAVLLSLWWVMALYHLLLALAALTGQVLMALLLFPEANLLALLRLSGGFLAVSLVCPALTLLLACASPDERALRRRGGLLLYGMLALGLVARLPGWTRWLRFASFWSLFEGTRLIFNGASWQLPLLALALTLVLILFALLSFRGREV